LGWRELAKLDAHFLKGTLQKVQPLNGLCRVLAGLLEPLDRYDLLLYAGFHGANMFERGTNIGGHFTALKNAFSRMLAMLAAKS
jgi:hypothetical protein